MIRLDLLLRSLLIQGSWNYKNLLGTGMAWALIPTEVTASSLGKSVPLGEVAGTVEPTFNAHPYLATVALGALTRAAADHVAPERVRRFREVLPSALGSLGDKLVWGAWRPFCLVGALLAALLGGSAWMVLFGLLAVYNFAHIGLRAWGLSAGLRTGLEVGAELRDAALLGKAERIASAGVLLSGILSGALLGEAARVPGPTLLWISGGAALLSLGLVWGETLRRVAPVFLLLLVLSGVVGPALLSLGFTAP